MKPSRIEIGTDVGVLLENQKIFPNFKQRFDITNLMKLVY